MPSTLIDFGDVAALVMALGTLIYWWAQRPQRRASAAHDKADAIASLEDTVIKLASQNKELRAALDTERAERLAGSAQRDTEITHLKAQITVLTQALAAAINERDSERERADAFEAHSQALQARVDTLQARVDTLEGAAAT